MVVDPLAPAHLASLGQQDFTVRIAPVRRAFLVNDGDADQLRTTLHAAMAIWGGGRCPIIPVLADGSLAPAHAQFAEFLGVSQAVDFTGGSLDTSIVPWPVTAAEPLADGNFWSLHPTVVETSGFREIFLPADNSLLSLAGAGGYGLDEEVPLFREAGFNIVENCGPEALATAQLGDRTAWAATLSHDIDTAAEGPFLQSAALLWVVDNPDSFADVVFFWNSRAVRPRTGRNTVAVIASRATVEREEFRTSFARAVRQTSSTTPSFIICGLGTDEAALRCVAEGLGGILHEKDRLEESFSHVTVDRPLTYLVNYDVRHHWLTGRLTGPVRGVSTALRRPSLVVEGKSPVPWIPRYQFTGRAKATITSNSITGPTKRAVAQLFLHQASWEGQALMVEVANLNYFRFDLNLPLPSEILRTAVGSSGVAYSLSDKGQQILGASRLTDDLNIFRRRSVHALVSALTRTAGRDLAKQLAALRYEDRVSEKAIVDLRTAALLGDRPYKSLDALLSSGNSRGIGTPDARDAVDELVACEAIEMGMAAHCPLCSLKEFQPLTGIDGPPRCRGCGARATFTGAKAGHPEVHYRLSSLMHTLSLNGGLAPLAAYALLNGERAFAEPGVNLQRDGSHVGELDLLGWRGPILFAAEAKSSTTGFDKADIATDIDKAVLVGADVFTMVCTQRISQAAVARADKATKARGIALRVMDEAELLTDD